MDNQKNEAFLQCFEASRQNINPCHGTVALIKKFLVSHNTKFTINFRNLSKKKQGSTTYIVICCPIHQRRKFLHFFRSTNCITTYLRSKKYVFEKWYSLDNTLTTWVRHRKHRMQHFCYGGKNNCVVSQYFHYRQEQRNEFWTLDVNYNKKWYIWN